ncbi:MAG: hypothetical protein Q9O62_12885, partial [Ardenticatenia bacterium]|nr:hypothetical protein [Ardenticatenia bacterium]
MAKWPRSARLFTGLAVLGITLMLAACAASSSLAPTEEGFRAAVSTPEPAAVRTEPAATPTMITEELVPPQALRAIVGQLSDLLGREVNANEVQVILIEKREWRDTSFECPKPGQMYQPVVTPGYRIVVLVDTQKYEFRTDEEGQVVLLCQPVPISTPEDEGASDEEEQMNTSVLPDKARRAFEKALSLVAKKSKVDREAITLTAWEAVM